MTKKTGRSLRSIGLVGAVVMLLLIGSVVGLGASAVTPRVFTGSGGSVLLFDNETGETATGIEIVFDAPAGVGAGDVIAFGGDESTEVFTWADSAWVSAELIAGGTLQVSLSEESTASVVSASFSNDPRDRLKALNARAYEARNTADLAALQALSDPGFVHHQDANTRNLEEDHEFLGVIKTVFPDMHFTIHDTVAEGDRVGVRYTFSGTWLAPWGGIPPSGETITFTGAQFHRFGDDGKMLETLGNADTLGLLQQLGIAPPTGRETYTWTEPAEQTGEPSYDLEANKALVLQSTDELWNAHNPEAIDKFMAPNYVHHDPGLPMVKDINGYKAFVPATLAAFPDFHSTVNVILAEGDRVATRVTVTGTQLGEYRGLPPTGNEVNYTAVVFFRIEDGMIAETWWSIDVLSVLRQLGVIPSPGG